MGEDDIDTRFGTEADYEDVLSFLLEDFVYRESLNQALQLKVEDCRGFFGFLVRKGLRSGTSVVMRNYKGDVVGTRLSAYLNREEAEGEGGDENMQVSPKAELILQLLEKVDENRWDRVPAGVDKLFYIIVLSVHSSYGRRGLGKKLLTFGLDQIRADGAKGIISEATATNSQALFSKLGYRVLYEVRHEDHVDSTGKRIFSCPDGTSSAQLVYLPL